ncbi:vacuolar ATPase V0 domain subunit c [Hypoxylon texense]
MLTATRAALLARRQRVDVARLRRLDRAATRLSPPCTNQVPVGRVPRVRAAGPTAQQKSACARALWALLGAFVPFYRSHAVLAAPFLPGALPLGPGRAGGARGCRCGVQAPGLCVGTWYTAMYRASATGAPVVNSLLSMYPGDANTFGIDTQFFYGDALLVSPVVDDDDAESVTYYLPDDIFYDFWALAPVRGAGAHAIVENVTWTDIARAAAPERFSAPRGAGSLYLDDGESLDVGEGGESEIGSAWDGTTFKAARTFSYATGVAVESVVVLGGEQPVTEEGLWSLNEPFEFTLAYNGVQFYLVK